MTTLEIEIYSGGAPKKYRIRVSFDDGSGAIDAPVLGDATIDVDALPLTSPTAYGQALSAAVLADPKVAAKITEGWRALSKGAVRIRLMIERAADSLHRVRWELLTLPDSTTRIVGSSKAYFSRFLAPNVAIPRAITLHARETLRSLVFVADPADANKRVAVADECRVAREALLAPITLLASVEGATRRPTIRNLLEAIGRHDVCYIACHGSAPIGDEAGFIVVENENGNVEEVPIETLVADLASRDELPTLVVLASCESAGALADGDGLASLGPRLVDAGIPLVIAMQGKISKATATLFMQKVFTELRSHGVIDRAVSVARNSLVRAADDWMPVLFSRHRPNAIWSNVGDVEKGNAPMAAIATILWTRGADLMLPILGPGVLDNIIGSTDTLPQDLSMKLGDVPPAWTDLPRLAQFHARTQSRPVILNSFLQIIEERAMRYCDEAGELVDASGPIEQRVLATLGVAWKIQERIHGDLEPHRFVASFNSPIFVTTNIDDSLTHALKAIGKKPIAESFPWRLGRQTTASTMRGTIDSPLVYHLFGRLSDPNSLVLTEDDLFDYLIATGNQVLHADVAEALNTNPSFLLGFRIEDWRFRVMFRSLYHKAPRLVSEDAISVAAQALPDQGDAMKRYLEAHFSKKPNISLYWGTVTDFVEDLYAAGVKAGLRK